MIHWEKLSKVDRASVEDALENDNRSLYTCLHAVGDDPIKSIIQETLQDLLDEETYEVVVAVFKAATDDY